MEPHPNSYTFSKRLAETIVADMHPKIPAMIIRPSIGKHFLLVILKTNN